MRALFFKILSLAIGLLSLHCLAEAEKKTITSYDLYFSDTESLVDRFISLINDEKDSIRIAMYCLRHNRIAKALIAAHQRGVYVEIIVDPFSVKSRAPIKKFAEKNMHLYIWNSLDAEKKRKKKEKIAMHDAFCVFGGKRIWTGSIHFSQEDSEKNQDHVLLIEQENLVELFVKQFEKMKIKSISYPQFMNLSASSR